MNADWWWEAWREDAACRSANKVNASTSLALFFPVERGIAANRAVVKAKAICAKCTVIEECLDYALEHEVGYGVWGGLTVRQRRNLKRTRRLEETA